MCAFQQSRAVYEDLETHLNANVRLYRGDRYYAMLQEVEQEGDFLVRTEREVSQREGKVSEMEERVKRLEEEIRQYESNDYEKMVAGLRL